MSRRKRRKDRPPDVYLTLAELAVTRHGAIQKPKELARLARLVHELQAETVLEIGTALGGTFYCWIHVARPDALLVSVDLPHGSYRSTTGDPTKTPDILRELAKPEQRVKFIREDSHLPETLDATREALEGRPVDYLFIDGDHSYEGVKADFEMYSPLVREGGLIAFHDIVTHAGWQECYVEPFWRETKPAYEEHWELVDASHEPQQMGIGVLRA